MAMMEKMMNRGIFTLEVLEAKIPKATPGLRMWVNEKKPSMSGREWFSGMYA